MCTREVVEITEVGGRAQEKNIYAKSKHCLGFFLKEMRFTGGKVISLKGGRPLKMGSVK